MAATAHQAPEGFEAPARSDYLTEGQYDCEKSIEADNAYLKRFAAEFRKNGSSDLLVEVIRFQRGDGYAQYMVWNTRPLQLIWIELGDAWSVEPMSLRGMRVGALHSGRATFSDDVGDPVGLIG